VLIDGTLGDQLLLVITIFVCSPHLCIPISHLCIRDSIALGYLVPTFGAHHVLSSKTTLTMPPRRFSQRLHPDEDLHQTSTQNQVSTHTLSTIAEGSEHPAFGDIPEVHLHQPANMSTTAVASSQNGRGASSTQTNCGAPHQSLLWAPLPMQVIQGDVELEQVHVQDWRAKASEDEAAKEEELLRVQQEIERLHQEQESIMRRQAAFQRAEAWCQHINRERESKARRVTIHRRHPSLARAEAGTSA
jgi:hypothetical protein